ncbi:alpha-tocopherol transfer protein-like isoform X1 [Homalodisca vitripennis]|uniref:alpha-tocopherol transfer protein-like isoform X1 n=2 Tax=Homalodisca vitripennis TaxID=197043 RepID=UPI001EEB6653|nr:alpha-tocopherol transfer protein-like isoform X1 [Homalodisca vitripennis]
MPLPVTYEKVPEGNSCMLSTLTEVPVIELGSHTLKLEVHEPSPELLEKARKELRETPDLASQSIATLQDLIKEDAELTAPVDNVAWLTRFLRPTKFYPESAYTLVKNYYSFKVKHKNMYDGLVPSKEKNIFDHDILTVLPMRDQDGRRILVIQLGKKWKHNKCSLDEVFKGAVLFMEAAMLEPETQISGAEVIFDMDGLTLQQTWQFTPPFAKRIVDWLQDSVPLRIKGIHIVNQPYIFNMVFALFKPFLRDKLRNRIYFHGTDRNSLHKHLSPKYLPECYGGSSSVVRVSGPEWYELLLRLEKEYEAINSYGYKKVAKK